MPARMYYDNDAPMDALRGQTVAVIGYGSQGHAHALNLRDSGARNLVIALRPGSPSAKKAEGEGLKVMDIAAAAKWASRRQRARNTISPSSVASRTTTVGISKRSGTRA